MGRDIIKDVTSTQFIFVRLTVLLILLFVAMHGTEKELQHLGCVGCDTERRSVLTIDNVCLVNRKVGNALEGVSK